MSVAASSYWVVTVIVPLPSPTIDVTPFPDAKHVVERSVAVGAVLPCVFKIC